jgi:hypothetical protein
MGVFWVFLAILLNLLLSVTIGHDHLNHEADELLHVHSTLIFETGNVDHPWRRLHARKVDFVHGESPPSIVDSSPPYGDRVELSFSTHGAVNKTFTRMKFKHYPEVVHEDAVIEYFDKNSERRQISFPQTVYKLESCHSESCDWGYLVLIDGNSFHAIVHDEDGRTIFVEPTPLPRLDLNGGGARRLGEKLARYHERHMGLFGMRPSMVAYRTDRIGRRLESKWAENPIAPSYLGPYELISGTNCLPSLKRAEIGLAVDAGFFHKVSGGDQSAAGFAAVSAYLASLVAILNKPYVEQLNVLLQIKHIVAFTNEAQGPTESSKDWNQRPNNQEALNGGNRGTHGCPVSTNKYTGGTCCCGSADCSEADTGGSNPVSDHQEYLTRFTAWVKDYRGTSPCSECAAFHAFTNCFPAPGTVGLAYEGTVCRLSWSYGWNTLSETSLQTWETFAHELGHTFGAAHTTQGIMSYNSFPEFKLTNQKTDNTYTNFDSMCDAINTGLEGGTYFTGNCFKSVGGTCGNSVVEDGEECDGGTCCTVTCQLVEGAQCDKTFTVLSTSDNSFVEITNDCCTSSCQFELPTKGCTILTGRTGVCMNNRCVDQCNRPKVHPQSVWWTQCPAEEGSAKICET